jgi:hypothetical protein
MTDPVVLRDLTKLAKSRCREAVMSVGQLIESDSERAAVLTTVAMDLMRGAATMMEQERNIPFPQALVLVFNSLALKIEKEVTDVRATPDRPARQKRARE